MKKNSILALVLTVAMIFAVNVPAMAAEVTTTPAGGTLFLPPAGQMSSVELGLDVDGTPAEGVTSNITNNTAGVFKSGNSLILDGELTKAGSVTVNATAGGNTASSTMQVSPYILYEDFEDGTVGANVSTTKIEKLSASAEDKSMFASTSTALIAGDSSNKYGDGNSSASTVVIPLDALSENGYNGKVTITAKIRRDNGDETAAYPGIQLYNTNGATLFNFRFIAATTTSKVYTKVSADGVSIGSNGTHIGAVNTNGWIDVRFELDLANGTYNFSIGGIPGTGYKMLNSPTNVSLGTIQFGVRVDDIAIYSGASYESTNAITGTETIYAPKAGSFAKVDGYNVVDSEASAIENATIALADSYAGMQIRNNALLISNDVTTGKKTLIATDVNGDFLAKGVVEVSPYVFFEDFEDGTANANPSVTKIKKLDGTDSTVSLADSKSTAVIATEENNKYVDANPGADGTIASLSLENAISGKVTVNAKVRVDGVTSYDLLTINNSAGIRVMALRYNTNLHRLLTKQNKDGSYHAAGNTNSMESVFRFIPGEWTELQIVIDFDSKTYDLYANGDLIMNDFAVNANLASNFDLKSISCNFDIDEVSVYSGTPYTIVADEARLTIPAAGESSTSITAKYNDGTAVSNLVCTTATAGVTGEGNQVKVSSETAVAPVTVTLSDGFVTGTATFEVDKNYVLVNGTEYTGGTALNTGSNSIYAVYGASDMEAGNIIYIARYSKDGELISLENFAKSQTTATMIETTLTDSFGENDFAKVFVWDDGTLKPLKAAVEVK